MAKEFDLEKTLIRIEAKISKIANKTGTLPLKEGMKATWVKVSTIKSLTGWNKDQLYYARKTGKVKMKKRDGGIFYLLESLHETHYKK